jgi:hypothetical protein
VNPDKLKAMTRAPQLTVEARGQAYYRQAEQHRRLGIVGRLRSTSTSNIAETHIPTYISLLAPVTRTPQLKLELCAAGVLSPGGAAPAAGDHGAAAVHVHEQHRRDTGRRGTQV